MFAHSNTHFRFAQNDLTWWHPSGWRASHVRSTFHDAIRFRRLFWWHYVVRVSALFRSKAQNEAIQKKYAAGCARLVRVDSPSDVADVGKP
jgi:hypothetical protein